MKRAFPSFSVYRRMGLMMKRRMEIREGRRAVQVFFR